MDDIPGLSDEEAGVLNLCRPCGAPHDNKYVNDSFISIGACFLCNYSPVGNTTDQWLQADREDSVSVLKDLVSQYGDLALETQVDLIFRFHNLELRKLDPSLPAWTRASIYSHLTEHTNNDDRLLINQSLAALNAQIQSVRAITWQEPAEEGGRPTPNIRNIQLLSHLIKTTFDGVRLRKSCP